MNKRVNLSIYIGAILITITLAIFFIPNFEEPRTLMQYAKLGFLLLSEVILTAGFIFYSKWKKTLLEASIVYSVIVYFMINFILVVRTDTLKTLVVFETILILSLLVLFLAIINIKSHISLKNKKIDINTSTQESGKAS